MVVAVHATCTTPAVEKPMLGCQQRARQLGSTHQQYGRGSRQRSEAVLTRLLQKEVVKSGLGPAVCPVYEIEEQKRLREREVWEEGG